MKTPRPLKDLLQIMLDNIDLLETGLCLLTHCLAEGGTITDNEYYLIRQYINKYPTKYYGTHFHFWPIGEAKPRIAFLKRHIKKLSK